MRKFLNLFCLIIYFIYYICCIFYILFIMILLILFHYIYLFYVVRTLHFEMKMYNNQRNAQVFLSPYLLLPYMFQAFFKPIFNRHCIQIQQSFYSPRFVVSVRARL
jgi:hypothetical protein